ncbi:carboxypeptidase regulatory-like domain-containing protein [Cellulomonas sp.]|uniref:carboxypeptidase regulatory-like domain-containing protein n=1 Tax=Cellulomonas sp. TaxID=40001 RepID=UPI003BAA4709
MRSRTVQRSAVGVALAMCAIVVSPAGPATAADAGSIAGVVVDEDGLPVEGVTVTPSGIGVAATTASDGSYEISGLAPDDYRLAFRPPTGSGLVPEYFDDAATLGTAEVVRVGAGDRVDGIDAELVVGGVVSGRMIGVDGTPVAAQQISLSGTDALDAQSVSTRLDGTFEFDALGDRDYSIYFGAAAGEQLSVPQPLLVRGRPGWETVLPDVVVRWNGLVKGRARDAQGNPVAGVRVDVASVYGEKWVVASAWTAADGSYQLRGMGAGVWRIRTNATLSPSGMGSSPVPTYWSSTGSTERSAAAGSVWAQTGADVFSGIDLTIRRTGSAVVDLGATVLHSNDVDWSTVQLSATGGAGVPTGVVEVRGASDGYRYGDLLLDPSGRARLPLSLGFPLRDLSLLYSGDSAYAPTNLTIRSTEYVPYPPASGVVAMEPQRLVDEVLEPGAPRCRRVAGQYTIPADAVGAIVNVTAVGASGPGYAVVYPAADGAAATLPPANGATVNFEPGADVSNAAFVALSDDGSLCWASPAQGGRIRIVIDITGYVGADAGIALQPHERILDTRQTSALRPKRLTTVQITGHGGVPVGATSVLLNVAVTGVRSVGHLRIQPDAVGEAVTTHYVPGATKSVAALATLSPTGSLTLWSETATDVDVILDVVGWVIGSDVYHPITPTRIVDSRPGSPVELRRVPGPLTANAVYTLPVRGVGVVPADATGVVLSVTAIAPDNAGNLSLYPDADGTGKTPRPAASNINYVGGRNIPNLVVVALPSNGHINLVSQMPPGGKVNVAIEVVGYLTD